MNNFENHNRLSQRFDKDATDGFESIPDAEMYFKEIKNPFTTIKSSAGGGQFTQFFIGIIFAAGLIAAGTICLQKNFEKPLIKAENKITTNEKFVAVTNAAPLIESKLVVSTELNKLNSKINQKNDFKIETLNISTHKSNSSINNNEPTLTTNDFFENYTYNNHSPFYKLFCVKNLLVINYSDSFPAIKKWKPLLTGFEASIESDSKKTINTQMPEDWYEYTAYNYNADVNALMDFYSSNKHLLVQKQAADMLKHFKNDQNALFYAALSCFENGENNKAELLFQEIQSIPNAFFEQESDYYIALILAKTNRVEEAKSALNKIKHLNSFYNDKAKILLNELK